MDLLLILLTIAVMETRAEVTQMGCQLTRPQGIPLTDRGIQEEEIGRIHHANLNNSICFPGVTSNTSDTHSSCCSSEMESAFLEEALILIQGEIERNLHKAQDTLQEHTGEFEQFLVDSFEYARQRTIIRLNRSFYINEGMLDEINALFEEMERYVHSETGEGRAGIARAFFNDLYSEMIAQKTRRRTKKYINCSLRVMKQVDPYFIKLHSDYVESIITQPLIDAKAYLLGLKEVRGIFSRLEGLTVSDGCTMNILKLKSCSYCRGHGLGAPVCQQFCPRLYKGCTLLHRGVFYKRWVAFVDVMRLISENMIQIPFTFMKLPYAIGNAVQDFNRLWRRTHYHIAAVCGRHKRPEMFGFIGELSDPPYVERDYYGYAVSVADDDVVGNLTKLLTEPETFCQSSGDAHEPVLPCWNGTDMSYGEVNPGLVLSEKDTPPEVLEEARLLKRLTIKLRRATLQGVDHLDEVTKDKRPAENEDDKRVESSTMQYQIESCPNRWAQYNTSCYFMTSSLPFPEARDVCISHGGDVSSVLSAEENGFISELLARGRAWIGATRDNNGAFFWLDGSNAEFNETVLEENDFSHGCAEIIINYWGRGLWKTAPCSNRKIAVCKIAL